MPKYKVLKQNESDSDTPLELNSTVRSRNTAQNEYSSSIAGSAPTSQSPNNRLTSTNQSLKTSSQYTIIEYTIDHKNNETLNSIALKFRCDVHELKRYNNIHSDTGFHALTSLKIPIPKFSSLLHDEKNKSVATISIEDGNPQTNSPTSNVSTHSSSSNGIGTILRGADKQLEKLKAEQEKRREASESIHQKVQNIAPSGFNNSMLAPIDSEATNAFLRSGTRDNSESLLCNWKVLLVLLILGLLVLPLLYGYIFEQEHEFLHDKPPPTTQSTTTTSTRSKLQDDPG